MRAPIDQLQTAKQIRHYAKHACVYLGDEIDTMPWTEGLDFWEAVQAKRAQGSLLHRKDFSPYEFRKYLPNIFIHNVEYGPLRFKSRIMGTAFAEAVGFDMTGQYADEVEGAENVVHRAAFVVHTQQAMAITNLSLTWSARNYKSYSFVCIPLYDQDNNINMLLYWAQFQMHSTQQENSRFFVMS
ncbi:MAG: PAS domain-containing protein [Kordiimonadaceae bacterium]|nr:PAS domain-containing protein [Kordiimonadaceae bacterium]